jgi:4'-phosphopantetheinyl transferase
VRTAWEYIIAVLAFRRHSIFTMTVIHVHDFAIGHHLALLDDVSVCLPPDELARAARFKVESARTEYLVARLLLRRLLAEHLGSEPGPFGHGPQGKPALPGSGIEFNLSHSCGRVLVVLCADHPVGVDVERLDPAIDPVALARTGLSEVEVTALLAVPEEERHTLFYRLWTRHEACLKALGSGLGHAPTIVARLVLGDSMELREPAGDNGPVVVCDLPAEDGFQAAVAIAGCISMPGIVRHTED